MPKFDLNIDVTKAASLGSGPVAMAATVHMPDIASLPARPTVVFACPGGGYGRGYFDMRFEAREGYSQAEHHAAHGVILVGIDHIGVGDSSAVDLGKIQFENLAAGHDACCREILQRLTEGSIAAAVPPVTPAVAIGIGQSMGGCVTVLTQAGHQTFDGIGVLGYSAIRTRLPQRSEAHEAADQDAVKGIQRGTATPTVDKVTMADYVYPFHWEDVPKDILDADMSGGYPVRKTCPPFGSNRTPNCAIQMMLPGVISGEAAAIEVPVFVGNGERDVCPDPRAEPTAYLRSNLILTLVFERMAHMHNFASTRRILWDRLVEWYDVVSSVAAEKESGN